MPSSSSSASLLLPLLLLPLLRPSGAAGDAACVGSFRSGHQDFVLDAVHAVKEGAVLLATAYVQTKEDCERACCDDSQCNAVLLEPRGSAAAENRTCVLFNCVHRNRFRCRFVNQAGYTSYIRQSVYAKYLQGPQVRGEQAPPIAVTSQDMVIQAGETVTLSGIESVARGNAKITDYDWKLHSGDDNFDTEGTEYQDEMVVSNLQPGLYVFQLTVTDSNNLLGTDTVNILVLNPEQTNWYCRAPVKVGPCRAHFPRWHYNASTGTCQKFVFGGCKQNKNNYLSENECMSACRGVNATSERSVTFPTEACDPPCLPGQLICNGSESDEEQCSKLNQTFSRLLRIDVNQKEARCTEPPLTGPCRASHSRWYYDPLDRKCHHFTFGGCHENGNNFEKESKCNKECEGVTEQNVFIKGVFDRLEKDENDEESDSAGSIALAVLLSVAILALLVILTYCFLRSRKRRTHTPVATGPAHVPLAEQDALVYNSTTKPA